MKLIADLTQPFLMNQIHHFIRILLQIIHLIRIQQIDNQLIPAIKNTAHGLEGSKPIMIHFISSILHKNMVIHTHAAVCQLRIQAFSFKGFRDINPHHLKDSRSQVDMGNRILIHPASKSFDQKRDPRILFIRRRAFSGQGMGKQHVSVIRRINNHCIRRIFFRRFQYPSDFIIHISITAKKLLMGSSELRILCQMAEWPGPQSLEFRLVFQGIIKISGTGQLIIRIHIHIFLRAQIWPVRLVKRCHTEEILIVIIFQEIYRPVSHSMAEGKFLFNIILFNTVRPPGYHSFLRSKLFQVVSHIIPVICIPALRTSAQAEIIASVQMPFADIGRMYPMIGQTLSDTLHIPGNTHGIGP